MVLSKQLSQVDRDRVAHRTNYCCYICSGHLVDAAYPGDYDVNPNYINGHIEHIRPFAKNGGRPVDKLGNLLYAHGMCNLKKSTYDLDEVHRMGLYAACIAERRSQGHAAPGVIIGIDHLADLDFISRDHVKTLQKLVENENKDALRNLS